MPNRIDIGSHRYQRSIQSGELPLGNSERANEQHIQKCACRLPRTAVYSERTCHSPWRKLFQLACLRPTQRASFKRGHCPRSSAEHKASSDRLGAITPRLISRHSVGPVFNEPFNTTAKEDGVILASGRVRMQALSLHGHPFIGLKRDRVITGFIIAEAQPGVHAIFQLCRDE